MPDTGGTNNQNPNSVANKTQKTFTIRRDCNSAQNAGTYPNYSCEKTRSGHTIIKDDTPGSETITIQHRSGTAIQMSADGGMTMTTHNGKYEVVFGEERVTISGASDITVKGDASLRCYGDYNVTVHKDYNLTVMGNMNVTSKNLNRSVRGTIDTEAHTENKRIKGTSTENVQGASVKTSKANMTLASTTGVMQVAGYSGAGFYTTGKNSPMVVANLGSGKNYVSGSGDWHYTQGSQQTAGAKYGSTGSSATQWQVEKVIDNQGYHYTIGNNLTSKIKLGDVSHTVSTGNHTTQVTGQKSTKAGSSNETVTTGNKVVTVEKGSSSHVVSGGNIEMRAPSGAANFTGLSTTISALGGLLGIAGQSGIALDSLGSLLNLNGGIAQIASALGLSLPFNINLPTAADSVPQLQGPQADQPTEEPDAISEIDSWM